jgi:hypothetical protein
MAQDTSNDVSWALLLITHPVYCCRLVLRSQRCMICIPPCCAQPLYIYLLSITRRNDYARPPRCRDNVRPVFHVSSRHPYLVVDS